MPRRIWVRVKPHAKKATVAGLGDDTYQASVHGSPQDGKAHEALLKLLAGHFSLLKSKIKIPRGHSARKKLVELG